MWIFDQNMFVRMKEKYKPGYYWSKKERDIGKEKKNYSVKLKIKYSHITHRQLSPKLNDIMSYIKNMEDLFTETLTACTV